MMAIRLRRVDGEAVALCAALTQAEPGDIYVDDEWHYALAQKFWRDYPQVGITPDEDDVRRARGQESHPR